VPARNVVVPIAVVVATCATYACKRGSYYRTPPISGVRFFASSKLSGDRSDTLLVSISGRNSSREMREIEIGGCPDRVVVRVSSATRAVKTWSSVAWRRDSLARLRARGDTAPDGHRMIYGLCVASLPVKLLAPGDSGLVAAVALPVRAVLGDSLVPGRYRIEARLLAYAEKPGFLRAGEVDLRIPGP